MTLKPEIEAVVEYYIQDHTTILKSLSQTFSKSAIQWDGLVDIYICHKTLTWNRGFEVIHQLRWCRPLFKNHKTIIKKYVLSQLIEIIKSHLPKIHCYADDTQVYISFSPNDRAEQLPVVRSMEDCIRDIRSWMLNNNLKLNDDKTELFIQYWYTTTVGKATQYQYLCGWLRYPSRANREKSWFLVWF